MADPMSLCNLVFQCWTCIGGPNRSTYVCNLEDNQKSLSDRLEELQDLRNEVKRRAEEAETRGMTRTDQVDRWLHRVEQKEGEAQNMLHQCSQRIANDCHCLGDYCPKNCCGSYKLGKKVALLLSNVLELINQGKSFNLSDLAYKRSALHGEEFPLPAIKGMDLMFGKACSCIRENQAARIIGLYGTGGIGKTTLLKKINNEFLVKTANNSDFDPVIWAVVSKELNTAEIRKQIGDQLGITRKEDANQVAEATVIFRLLNRQKKFLLLLDDVWERVDLEEIGIPHPSTVTESNNKSKVIFTTRSEKVCGEMEAKNIFKVECLRDDEACNLFEEKVGEDTLNCDPDIRQLARDVVKECGGLPLALITIGRAMASKRTRHEWEHAITVLQKSPAKFSGMEEKVFSILKYSYDALADDKVKSCFLYCSLFPEDFPIKIEGLIEYWIGEGFIKGNEEMREAMNEGYDIIETLKRACLLEPGGNDYFLSKNYVKMHDVIRDMALWIVNDYGRNDKKKHLVVRYEELMDKLFFKWQGANRIFMLRPRPPYNNSESDAEQQQIKDEVVVPPDEEYPNLIPIATFLVAYDSRKEFPTSLFRSTKSLRVLDLSYCLFGKVKFPTEIVELAELEYLNLSFTDIKELPYELGKLRKLRYLNLYYTRDLHVVSVEGILKLLDLQYLDLFESNFMDWEMEGRSRLMEVFEALKHLTDFRVTISSDTSFQSWSNSYKLQKYTTALCLGNYKANSFRITTTLDNMFLKTLAFFKCEKLREISWRMETKKGSEKESALRPEILLLEIVHLPKLEIIELPHMCLQNIQYIQINNCMVLEDLTWLRHTHKLERLWLLKLPRLKKIINAEEILIPFSNLEFLYLWDLPALEDIYPGALPLPCLMEIHMVECPKLKKLPFGSNSANNSNLRKIEGRKEWWEALEWDDESSKSIFQQYFTEK
ncbi:PREDICTED: probable disease resistance protein At1g61300 [Nelumbo nucifera]|uniref:Probable disease resistance protein At1g61300 n=1 Tax=Nelumbo nucifera TaxID=4432 RepID=A0A1U8AKT5_NELNU|nr:PREDICTED: probable disease resistance protein At1g61300 [Nelumbo nucifera]